MRRPLEHSAPRTRDPRRLGLLAGLALLASACSSGSGSSSSATGPGFRVEQISVKQNAVWEINRPIDITFTDSVDFATVNLNTVSLVDLFGEPASGSFILRPDGRTVRFRPSCPTQDDYQDAGLRPGSTYRLLVLSTTSGGPTVLSTGGEELEVSQSVTFNTPDSNNPLELFVDTVVGPPGVRVRGRGNVPVDSTAATYLEVLEVLESGESVPRQVFFEWNSESQRGELPPSQLLPGDGDTSLLPLNLYSRPETRIAVVVHLDQPVDPASSNVSGGRIGLEYEASPGQWQELATDAELIENCTTTGAAVRLNPRGILPQGAAVRVNLRQGFRDLTGAATLLDAVDFARAATTVAENPVAGSGDDARSADEVLERFLVGGSAEGSLEDTGAVFAEPFADWGSGQLRASFDFGGSGGPGGDFTWRIPAGTTRILDSTTDVITGGPGGTPTTSQTVVNGVIDVQNLIIEEGATLFVQGPNPLTILAAGDVLIDGTLAVSGSASPGVGTLNTTNLPEPGGAGQAGGGTGGTGSFLTNQSTPRGGAGFGAFNAPGGGGQGGETGYATGNKNNRRGAGGGGGRFGPDVIHPLDDVGIPNLSEDPNVLVQILVGFDGESGFDGGPEGLGAESQTDRAQGGALGPEPFFDQNPENNFLGSKIRRFAEIVNGQPVLQEELVIGELTSLWAGAGGGAGGDAVNSSSFPLTPFNIGGDEKGAGGGGGAGGLRILATGDVILGPQGRIEANGGGGGGGENTNFFDRVGGGSGGGSGGHIVISSAGRLVFEGNGAPAAAGRFWYNDVIGGSRQRTITALGGQGGAGQQSQGGFNEDGATVWFCDAIPYDAFRDVNTGELIEVPPLGFNCFMSLEGVEGGAGLFDWGDPDNQAVPGAGGDGSPGIIQIHVNDPDTDIVFPDAGVYGQGAAVTRWFAPPPHGWNAPSGLDVTAGGTTVNVPPDFMVPFFGRLSRSRSKWVPLGLARVNDGDVPVAFQFEGTTDTEVDRNGSQVDLGTPLLGPLPLGSGLPFVVGDAQDTLVLDASGLTGSDEIYRRNPLLLRDAAVRLEQDGGDAVATFQVIDASYDADLDRLTVQIAGEQPIALQGVPTVDVRVSLLRRDFLVATSGVTDLLPVQTGIEIEWQATVADLDGLPSESSASPLTGDVGDLNAGGPWDFVRFQVTFDLNDPGDPGADLAETPRPGLRFLRLPFSF